MKNFVLPIFVLLFQTIWAQIPSYVPVYGLLSYYPFNGNGNDASVNANHLTNNGAIPTTDRFGMANSAFDFDGISAYMTKPNPNWTFSPTSTFSVSFWVNRQNTANTGIAVMNSSAVNGNFIWLWQANSVDMKYGTNKQGSPWIWVTNPSTNNIWTHYVLVYSAGIMKLYANNVFVGTNTFTHTAVNSANLPLWIGKGHGGSPFFGKIDDIGIWNRALTECEINDLYSATNTISTLSAGPNLSLCNGAPVTLNGTGAQSYIWSPNVLNGSAFVPTINQTYTLTGFDLNGCSAWDQTDILIEQFNINAGPDISICQGDSVVLTSTGANNIIWNNNDIINGLPFLPLNSGYISALASSSSGCQAIDSLLLTINPLPIIDAGPDQQICFGEEAIIYGTGGIFMYWNNGVADSIPFIPFTTTSYILTGASPEGCLSTDTVTVFVNESTSSTLNISAIDSYTLNGQTYTTSGSYTQVLTNAAGCDSLLTINLTLDFTGIEENVNLNWKLYPNPASDYTTLAIKGALMGSAIVLYDAFGREMLRSEINTQETIIDLQHVPSGIYLLKVGAETRRLEVVR
jgi:hypothetical protein